MYYMSGLVKSHVIKTTLIGRDVVLGTRTPQMRSKLPDADVSALIFMKCNDMSCV